MEILESKTRRFLSINFDHHGCHSHGGNCNCDCDCDDYGVGDGIGCGYGNSNGYSNVDYIGAGYGGGTGHGDAGDGDGIGCGYGTGYSDGYGYCDGYGYGIGCGNGYGDNDYSDGDGNGAGIKEINGVNMIVGDGNGAGIKEINGDKVHMIDGVATIITHVVGDLAWGFILDHKVYLKPCYVAKHDAFFGHGKTAKDAMQAAIDKSIMYKSTNERIELFLSKYNKNSRIPAKELFDWHGIITGSCKLGRENFCSNHDINMDTDQFTIDEFITLTINNYGSEIIKQLKEKWERIHKDNQ